MAIRRQPGDVRGLMRAADALWKLEVATKRADKGKEHEQARGWLAVMNHLNDPRMLAEEEG